MDVKATHESFKNTQGGMDNIVTDLETVQDSVTMLSFEYGNRTAVRVRAVPGWEWQEQVADAIGVADTHSIKDDVLLHLVELI